MSWGSSAYGSAAYGSFSPSRLFNVYVDEAGDEGFSRGSSEWFILAGIIIEKSTHLQISRKTKDLQTSLTGRKALHFKKIKNHHNRLLIMDEIRQSNLKIVTTLIHKASLPEAYFSDIGFLGFSLKLLWDRIGQCCVDLGGATYGKEIIYYFPKKQQFSAILKKIKTMPHLSELDWSQMEKQVRSSPGKLNPCLYLADSVASSLFAIVCPENVKSYGNPLDYAERLRPVLWKKDSEILGFGLNIEPKSKVIEVFQNNPILNFLGCS